MVLHRRGLFLSWFSRCIQRRQSTQVIHNVGRRIAGLQCRAFIGGSFEKEDIKQAKKCHIVVGSPGVAPFS